LLDELMAVIEGQHDHERDPVVLAAEHARRELVHRLLVETHVDSAEADRLGYELDAWHLGVIATGAKAALALGDLGRSLGCELLSVAVADGRSVWGWFGGSREIKAAGIKKGVLHGRNRGVSFAVGEAGRGIGGWRLTHRQAREAHRIAVYKPQPWTWYADDPLLAAALRDETLARSLEQKYLVPLREHKEGGVLLRETLRAYIDAACSATSAASVVGIGRHAVEGRIQTAERLIGCSIRACLSELDVALRMEELDGTRSDDRWLPCGPDPGEP
jgi:hypothetical protein